MSKKKVAKSKKLPAEQRDYQVGNKNPPKDYQWESGQSGNPKGPPKHRVNLWVWFCKYMNMTDGELKKLKREKLTQAQQTALKLVENAKKGEYSGSERLARHVFDREEGKPTEYLVVGGNENALSDDECDEIRKLLQKSHAN